MIGLFLLLFQDPQAGLFQQAVKTIQPISENEQPGLSITRCARYFLGKPYVEKSLEGNAEEQLVVRLDAFDCTTFVESVLALNHTLRSNEINYAQFQANLTKLRYRNAQIRGYASRLHYISEWRIQGEEMGFFSDLNRSLNGSIHNKTIDFMSSHANLYPALTDPQTRAQVLTAESDLNKKPVYFHALDSVPYDQLQSGDIVAITTSVPGLDVIHMGFVLRQAEQVHLLHASQKSLRVEISDLSLADYLAQRKSATGLFLLRPL
ncbi:MAG: DUF1460 domain-containing protein [Acidobacteria bacterium]|nr:DUF1460 domain-containing protein [Acidobacteriota bacterium]MCB9396297.1 DUF1460 domain-containing protein [Acidobacteriota bacterium]